MIMSLVLILSLVPTAFADEKVTFAVDEVSCSVDAGTTVDVAIKITKNPGVVGFSFDVNFDKDSLKLTAVNTAGSIMTAGGAAYAGQGAFPVETGKYGVAFDGDLLSANITATGEVVVLKFEVVGGATAGKKDITLTKIDSINFDLDDLGGEAVNGSITLIGNTPAHEHVWSDAWSKDATHHWHDCTAAGCDVTVNADKNGYAAHNYNKKVTTKDYLKTAANCTDAAVYYYSCECGAIGTKTFTDGTALGHTPSTVWSKDATHHWHVCTTCNAELNKEAHKPGPEATESDPQTCTVCGYEIAPVLPHDHNYTEQVATDVHKASSATCTAKATYYYSCKCGANGTETFEYGEPLGHSWGQHVADKNLKSAADCENPAVYYVSCGRCDARDTENTFTYGEKLGHKGGEWQSDENGHWKLCERVNCGKRFSEAPHNGGTATCQEKAKCEICGAEYGKLGEHNFDTKWTSDDTQHFHKCLTKGCDYIKDAADHSGGKATCKEKAKCDVCAAEYGNLGAHTLTKTAAKAPTCLEPGNNEYYTCSVCGKVFKDAAGTTETTVAAETLAKSTTHVVESKYATSATEHWQICKVCGTVVGKAAHKFGEADANGRKTCADCGYTVGGTGTEGHKHAAGNTICYDENNHWNKCTDDNCDAHVNESAHKFGPKNTVTEGNKTITIETCSECGYVKRTETTTGGTTPVNPGGNKPTKPGTKDNGKTVQSGKTFDAGVGVYVGLSILSLTGSAVVIGKKRKTR